MSPKRISPQKRSALRRKLQKLLGEFIGVKAQAARLEKRRKVLQTDGLDMLKDLGLTTFSYENEEGFKIKATRVQNESVIIDEAQLKKSLGAKTWNKLTVRVLDIAKLEDAIAEGWVDPITVSKCSEDKKNAPFIKTTAKAPKRKSSKEEPF